VEANVEFEAVVGPAAEFHFTDLNVERKVSDVDGAGGTEDGGRYPDDAAVSADHSHGVTMFLQTSVGAMYSHRRKTMVE